MTYLQLTYFHLATILPAVFIGAYLLLSKKGSPTHRALGKTYLTLMFITAFSTLFMAAEVGPQFFGHFGYIHLLSVLTLVSVPAAYFAAKNRKIILHASIMVSLFVGGILVAGAFTFMPGRLLHEWVFG